MNKISLLIYIKNLNLKLKKKKKKISKLIKKISTLLKKQIKLENLISKNNFNNLKVIKEKKKINKFWVFLKENIGFKIGKEDKTTKILELYKTVKNLPKIKKIKIKNIFSCKKNSNIKSLVKKEEEKIIPLIE